MVILFWVIGKWQISNWRSASMQSSHFFTLLLEAPSLGVTSMSSLRSLNDLEIVDDCTKTNTVHFLTQRLFANFNYPKQKCHKSY